MAAARKGGLKALLEHPDKGGRYAWEVMARTLSYAAGLVPGAAEDIADVDEAMRHRGSRISPLLTQAALRVAQDRLEEAIEVTEAAEREFEGRTDRQQLSGLYFTRGKAYALLGKTDLAETAFLTELELSPRALGAYSHLAFLYALDGKSALAGETLGRMVEANPTPSAHAAAVVALREMGDERSAGAVLRMALGKWPDSERLLGLADQGP